MAKPAPSLFEQRPPSAASRGASPEVTPSCEAIQSLEAADLALAELADLAAREEKIDADCKQELTLVRGKFAKHCLIVLEGRTMQIADRRQELLGALEDFADKYGEQVFDIGAKSKKLNHGEFGFRKSNAKLEDVEKKPAAALTSGLQAIAEKLRAALSKLKILFPSGDAKYVKVAVDLDRQTILAAAKIKELSAPALRRLGLRFVPPADKFFATPKAKEVASQSAESPD